MLFPSHLFPFSLCYVLALFLYLFYLIDKLIKYLVNMVCHTNHIYFSATLLLLLEFLTLYLALKLSLLPIMATPIFGCCFISLIVLLTYTDFLFLYYLLLSFDLCVLFLDRSYLVD